MSIIAGLDLSLNSAGIAILVDGEPKMITHVGHKGHNGDDWQHRSRRVRSQVRAVMGVVWTRQHDLAVIEGPSYGSPGDQFDRAALWHGVYGALEAKGIPIAVIAPNSLKLWWTGDGTADKLRMLNTARGRYRQAISTHDEADAVALAAAGARWLGDPIPFEPNDRQIAALGRMDWPVIA